MRNKKSKTRFPANRINRFKVQLVLLNLVSNFKKRKSVFSIDHLSYSFNSDFSQTLKNLMGLGDDSPVENVQIYLIRNLKSEDKYDVYHQITSFDASWINKSISQIIGDINTQYWLEETGFNQEVVDAVAVILPTYSRIIGKRKIATSILKCKIFGVSEKNRQGLSSYFMKNVFWK